MALPLRYCVLPARPSSSQTFAIRSYNSRTATHRPEIIPTGASSTNNWILDHQLRNLEAS